jgi:DNA-binding PadR family transcriptional regulator
VAYKRGELLVLDILVLDILNEEPRTQLELVERVASCLSTSISTRVMGRDHNLLRVVHGSVRRLVAAGYVAALPEKRGRGRLYRAVPA